MKGGSLPALRLQKRVLLPVLLCRFCAGAGEGGVQGSHSRAGPSARVTSGPLIPRLESNAEEQTDATISWSRQEEACEK